MTTLLRKLLVALAAGDSLGSTSEFTDTSDVRDRVYPEHRLAGWPFAQVGGGAFHWKPGAPTDDTDMARAMVESFEALGRFDGEDVGRRFVAWMEAGPRDNGGTTSSALRAVAGGVPWFDGGFEIFQRNPRNEANGSLMRNGVVAGMAPGDRDELFRLSIVHGLLTHWSPMPVVSCAAQTFVIDRLLALGDDMAAKEALLAGAWLPEFVGEFRASVARSTDREVARWRDVVGAELGLRLDDFVEIDFDADALNPFTVDYRGRAGHCALTLRIAMWAAHWAARGTPAPREYPLPPEVAAKTGGHTLGWVAMIGADSDTYGATAGPLVWAATGDLPESMVRGLLVASDA